MKVKVTITQKTLYKYNGKDSTSKNDIVLNPENLVDAIEFIQKMPNAEAVNIHVNVSDYDKRKSTEEESDS